MKKLFIFYLFSILRQKQLAFYDHNPYFAKSDILSSAWNIIQGLTMEVHIPKQNKTNKKPQQFCKELVL